MWKFVTRGIRETLERRTNRRTNIYSQNSQESSAKGDLKTNIIYNQKFLAPKITAYNNGFCDSTRSNGTKNKKEESKWDAKHNWTEAVGWSGVLALGWVVSQSLCLRRRIFEKEQHPDTSLQRRVLHLPEVHLKRLINHVLSLKPQFIIPTVYCAPNDVEKVDASTETDGTPLSECGPLTAEEALKEAEAKFAFAHKLAVAEYELRSGILAIEEKRYDDALKNFRTGAKMYSPTSMFNLALCHELGFGTEANDIKAARYYKKAAEMGHTKAMYNLAIFHAQGRGDFSVDIDRARTLFKRAADLGEEKAKEALKVDEKFRIDCLAKETEKLLSIKKTSSVKNIVKSNLFSNIAKYEDAYISKQSKKSESYFSDKKLDEEDSSTAAFLNLLGIKESAAMQPIANSC